MQSKAATVKEYLATLPPDRRAAIEAVRDLIRQNLDKDFAEGMQYGMIGYYVPHSFFPPGYHCDPKQPLPFAGLASQKNHMSIYMMVVYGDGPQWHSFAAEWAKTGKKLDMGKCCIRFKRVEDLALEVIAKTIRGVTARAYVDNYVKNLEAMGKKPGGGRAPAKAATAKAPAAKSASAKAATAKSAPSPMKKTAVKKAAKSPSKRKS